MLQCLVTSIIAIPFCLVLQTLTTLQHVQNRLACVVTKSAPFTRMVPLLHFLHWLSVKFRVHFKICLLTYVTVREKQPVHLHCVLATSLASRPLRSNRGITLFVPRVKTNTGARALHSCAPSHFWSAASICFGTAEFAGGCHLVRGMVTLSKGTVDCLLSQ